MAEEWAAMNFSVYWSHIPIEDLDSLPRVDPCTKYTLNKRKLQFIIMCHKRCECDQFSTILRNLDFFPHMGRKN